MEEEGKGFAGPVSNCSEAPLKLWPYGAVQISVLLLLQVSVMLTLTIITVIIILDFSALMLLVGRQEGHPACKKLEWWDAGVVICLVRGADLHMAQLMPLPLTVFCFSKIQIGLPFWYRPTRVVPEKGPLNGCVCVCVWYSLITPRVGRCLMLIDF